MLKVLKASNPDTGAVVIEDACIKYSQSLLSDGVFNMKKLLLNAKGEKAKWWIDNCGCNKGHAADLLEAFVEYESSLAPAPNVVTPLVVAAPSFPPAVKPVSPSSDSRHLKYVKLSSKLSAAKTSSGDSWILPGTFYRYMKPVCEVMIKLVKQSLSHVVEKEYATGNQLHHLAPSSFIELYDILDGSAGEIMFSDDDTTASSYPADYIGLVMEKGSSDITEYLTKYPDLHYLEIADICRAICVIYRDVHAAKYVVVDCKPANIVRVSLEGGRVIHKAIDFDNMVPVDTDITLTLKCTPRYASPELAAILLANKYKGSAALVTRASTLMDSFAFGLIVWEICNEGKSLWDALRISTLKEEDLLKSIANLTDEMISKAISTSFNDKEKYRACRSVLEACLKVTPTDRTSIKTLLTDRSFFGNVDPTVKYGDIRKELRSVKDSIDSLSAQHQEILNLSRSNQAALVSKLEAGDTAILDGLKEILRSGGTNSEDIKKFITKTSEASLSVIEDKISSLDAKVQGKLEGVLENLKDNIASTSLDSVESMQTVISQVKEDLTKGMEKQLSKIKDGKVNEEMTKQLNRIDKMCMVTGGLQSEVTALTSLVTSIGKALDCKDKDEFNELLHTLREIETKVNDIDARV